ncbi:hypothetical protein AMECASPLE_038969 [Ameca splendens]|uniref:Uncharacterized protein n=1 Tax=Ameca splendens TaxID=208324 RepID=A0ABV0ZJK2_9TELE
MFSLSSDSSEGYRCFTHTHTHHCVCVCVCVKQHRHEAGQLQASAGKRSTDGANRDAPERHMAAGTERKEEIQNKPGRSSAFYSELWNIKPALQIVRIMIID